MEKVEAVFGGPLARGSPGYGALKRGGGEGGGMKISKKRGGWGGLASGISPCFGSLELRGGMVCFLLFLLARAACILEGGWGDGWL